MNAACKIVFIGDSAAGKTSLLRTFVNKSWSEGSDATTIDKFTTKITLSDKTTVQLELWDTAGGEDYKRLRALAYRNALVIVLCISVESVEASDKINKFWIKEIRRFAGKSIPIVLVGTKVDLRENAHVRESINCQQSTPLTQKQGVTLGQRIGAARYIECSARQGVGLTQLFREIAIIAFRCRQAMGNRPKNKNCLNCSVM